MGKKQGLILGSSFLLVVGCTPTVKIEPSDKPITVNLNINVEHKLKVQVDKDIDNIAKSNPELF